MPDNPNRSYHSSSWYRRHPEMPQAPPPPTESTRRKESLAWVFNFIALAVAFGSWGYAVVAPEPNLWFGSLLLFMAVILIVAAGFIHFSVA